MNQRENQIRGCLLGAAVGDALGFCVGSLTLEEIGERYGPWGIQGPDPVNGYSQVSFLTQMMLYTANGLLFGATRGAIRGVMAPYVRYLEVFYREWASYQRFGAGKTVGQHFGWVSTVPEMRHRRGPDSPTLFALERNRLGTIHDPVNRSRCAVGLVRSIPVGLFRESGRIGEEELRLLGAESAALTVGDPMGFLPAAYLTDLLNRILDNPGRDLKELLHETCDAVQEQFGGQFSQLNAIREHLKRAEGLAAAPYGEKEVLEHMKPEDAAAVLAAAIFVCLRLSENFEEAVAAAVNHSGDSAAVGALVGAILGAKQGADALPEFFLEPMELREVMEELGSDLVRGCPMGRTTSLFDDEWDQKYVQCTWQ